LIDLTISQKFFPQEKIFASPPQVKFCATCGGGDGVANPRRGNPCGCPKQQRGNKQ
jgi:hypothetical protein